MAPRNRRLYRGDASEHAASQIEYLLNEERRRAAGEETGVSVEEAVRGEGVFEYRSERDITRALFISRDPTLLNPTQQSLDGFLDLSDLFDEVHILILRQGIPAKYPVLRVADNVWLYTASAKFWWWTPVSGLRLAHQELVFAGGFRPDLIVARDPFESALTAWLLGRRYDRPTQLHLLEDHTGRSGGVAPGWWRRFLARRMLPRFASVRTASHALQTMVEKRYTLPDVKTLPRFHDYEALIDAPATLDLKATYKPHIFFMLYIGALDHSSTLYRALDAARFALKNQRIALIVLGDGPAAGEFRQRAKTLGIEEQVIFRSRVRDLTPYLKSAHLLLVPDTDSDSEDVILRGAAAGIPMVMAHTPIREDIFEDGFSAFLCPPDDVQEFTNAINDLLNQVGLRRQFADATQTLIRKRFHEDPVAYRTEYRQTIEDALFVGDHEPSTDPTAPEAAAGKTGTTAPA